MSQPGQPELVKQIEAPEALVGSSGECDVVVSQPFVSRRHVRILKGVVVIDLESRNGTFLGGKRLSTPTVYLGGDLTLGAGSGQVVVRVETDPEGVHDLDPWDSSPTLPMPVPTPRGQFGESRPRSDDPTGDGSASPEMRRQLWDAQQRIEALKAELQARDVAGSTDVQVRLLRKECEELRQDRERLAGRIQGLEAELQAASGPAVRDSLARRIAELESKNAVHLQELEGLQARNRELETAATQKPLGNLSELYFRTMAENEQLRKSLARQEPGGAQAPLSEVYSKLQRENEELRKELTALQAPGGAIPAVPAVRRDKQADTDLMAPSVNTDRLQGLLAENRSLAAQREALSAELQALKRNPLATTQSNSHIDGRAQANVGYGLIAEACSEEFERSPVQVGGSVERFVFRESLRFVRAVERALIPSALGHIQILSEDGLMPGTQTNFRRILEELQARPEASDPRSELTNHLTEMRAWLSVILRANPEAAERFVDQIRHDLSEPVLIASKPFPAWMKVAGRTEAELWRRVSTYLGQLTADAVRDRLNDLVRQCSDEIHNRKGH